MIVQKGIGEKRSNQNTFSEEIFDYLFCRVIFCSRKCSLSSLLSFFTLEGDI